MNMENIMLQTMQHRKILFLISLPSTSEFKDCITDVYECLDELRQLHVDVREHIRHEDLAEANNYDVVIVVAHRDTSSNELLLSDGALSMKEFVSSIPSDFKGVIDFSSCYSATAFNAIKDHCPHCKVQVALVETTLLRRLIIYPTLVEYLYDNPEIDYGTAYKEVSKAFDDVVDGIDDIDMGNLPMTHLGQQMSSIYSPSEVRRDCPFQILVFFHYDVEKEVVKVKAQRWQTNAIIRDDFEIPIEMKEGEKISVTLSFDSPDNANIKEKDGEYNKTITIQKVMVVERFVVTVLPDFKGNGFLANIEMAKEDICFIRCAFNIDVVDHENKAPAEVVAEVPIIPEKAEEKLLCYSDVFTGRLFSRSNYTQFQNIIKKKENEEEKLFFVRKFVYNNDLFIKQLISFLEEKESELSDLLRQDDKKSEITFDLVPLLKKYVSKLQRKLDVLEGKILSVKKVKGVNVNFEEAALKFPPIEWAFIDISSEIKNLDYQIDMLKVFREIRDEIRDECKKGKIKKDEIKELVTQFLEHPHHDHVDQDLYDIFKESGTGSIIHSRSQGATTPFLALVLAMIEKEYISTDNGKEEWFINVDKFIDFSKNEGSLRTLKSRINKLVGLLENKDVLGKIKNYQKTEAGRISITAYYLLKVKVSIT